MSEEELRKQLEEIVVDQHKEIERLNKENNDLRKLYQRTYKHLFEKGNDELARYFQAQIDECPTFYVEPIVDYYEETKRLNNKIDKAIECIENKLKVIGLGGYTDLVDILEILKGSDKE